MCVCVRACACVYHNVSSTIKLGVVVATFAMATVAVTKAFHQIPCARMSMLHRSMKAGLVIDTQ